MGGFSCKLLYYMQSVSGICSVLNLTALSIERYYAIVHPLKAQYLCTVSKAKKTVLATWILAFVLASPIIIVQAHIEVGVRIKAFWCVRDFDSPELWRAQELYFLFVLLLVPTLIMVFSYTRIIVEVCRVFRKREEMAPTKKGAGAIPPKSKSCRRPEQLRYGAKPNNQRRNETQSLYEPNDHRRRRHTSSNNSQDILRDDENTEIIELISTTVDTSRIHQQQHQQTPPQLQLTTAALSRAASQQDDPEDDGLESKPMLVLPTASFKDDEDEKNEVKGEDVEKCSTELHLLQPTTRKLTSQQQPQHKPTGDAVSAAPPPSSSISNERESKYLQPLPPDVVAECADSLRSCRSSNSSCRNLYSSLERIDEAASSSAASPSINTATAAAADGSNRGGFGDASADEAETGAAAVAADSSRTTAAAAKVPIKLDDETKQVIRMLVLVVILFVVCWGPLLIFNVLHSFEHIGNYLLGVEKHLKTTFSLMAYFNSCLNPIIYGFMSKNFRESFLFNIRRLCINCRLAACKRNCRDQTADCMDKSAECIQLVKTKAACCRHRRAAANAPPPPPPEQQLLPPAALGGTPITRPGAVVGERVMVAGGKRPEALTEGTTSKRPQHL